MRWLGTLVVFLLSLPTFAAESPRLYLPFDGGEQPALAATAAKVGAGKLDYVPGVRGQAVRMTGDCRVQASGLLDVTGGTVAFWMRSLESADGHATRVLFCTYGDRRLSESYKKNRFSLTLSGGKLDLSVYDATGHNHSVSTACDLASATRWRHVAFTWSQINSGQANAELRLFIDGRQAAARTGLKLDLGETSGLLDIGRDSDSSPDYAQADLDDFYLYGQALDEATLRRGIEAARNHEEPPASLTTARGKSQDGWWNDAWRFRVTAQVDVPAGLPPRSLVRLAFDPERDLARLGITANVDLASVRVLPCQRQDDRLAERSPIASEIRGGDLLWALPGTASAGTALAYRVYFDVLRFDTSRPLCVRLARKAWGEKPAGKLAAADYAAETYGRAWDFETGFEEIDSFSRDIVRRDVRDGVLRLEVGNDPYIIWGEMWGAGGKTRRPISIDLARYPVLEMRVKQSVASSEWDVFGRPTGRDDLLRYEFVVSGTGWQVVRIDLRKTAGWKGVLSALRIDPTSKHEHATVEIDWIHLTSDVEARRDAVECWPAGGPQAATVRLVAAKSETPVGSALPLTVRMLDAEGKPVAAQPVLIGLSARSGGRLESPQAIAVNERMIRALTDADGRCQVTLHASRRAGANADAVAAKADFTKVASPVVSIATVPGPAHHYRIEPNTALAVGPEAFPKQFRAQLVDEFDNPLAVPGRSLTWSGSPGLALAQPGGTTDAQGVAQVGVAADASQACQFSLGVRDAEGLTGRSGTLVLAQAKPRPNPVRLLPNGYFAFADGRPYVPLGGFYANWVQRETPDGEWRDLQSFTDTTDEEKCRWMAYLREQGVTGMRFMLRTHRRDGMEPLDVGGKVNRPLLAEVLRYLDLGRRYDLQFQLVIHEDYSKPVYCNPKHFAQYTRPAFAGEDLSALPPAQRRFVRDADLVTPPEKYTDPDVIACQDRYVAELLPLLRGHPQVFCYELENEMVNCPDTWANHAIDMLRRFDPGTLVCASHGGGGLRTADPAWWLTKTKIDFYSPHLYPHGSTGPELDYGAAVAMLARYARMPGVSFLGESAGDEFHHHPSATTRRFVMRDIIWMALTAGHPGVFFWNARGAEVAEFRLARQAMEQLDLAHLRRAKPALGIDVRHALDDDKYFRSNDGKAVYEVLGKYVNDLLARGIEFDFTFDPSRYARAVSAQSFQRVTDLQPTVEVPPGWQASTLVSDDSRQALVYVRNLAGVEPWTFDAKRKAAIYLRTRAAKPLELRLHLAGAAYQATVIDLDTGRSTAHAVPGSGQISLGTSEHDFALVLKLKP